MNVADAPKQTLIGENLDRLISKHGIKPAELSRRTDGVVSEADVSRIRKGATPDPGIAKLIAMASVFGEPVDEFWAASGRDTEPTLQAFFDSDLGKDVTPAEKSALASTRWASGSAPTVTAWWHILQAVRASSR